LRPIIRLCLPLFALLLAACAELPQRPELPVQVAVPVGSGTKLDSMIAPAEASHPGQAGFRLVGTGPEAFAIRARSAQVAGRSLDVQTYIWNDDLTGMSLAYALLSAADRGVKVRLLVDDMDARSKNYGFAALDAHPNIEVRMFNPLPSRSGTLAFIGDFLSSGKRLNHRMHNKTWIADNRIAIVGGRNLGDEYFGASEDVNFVDLDFAMVGPVVRDASASFDKYWNSRAVYPVSVLNPGAVTPVMLENLRSHADQVAEESKTSSYSELLKRDDAVERLLGGDWKMEWSSEFLFVSDDPLKALKDEGLDKSDVLSVLVPVLKSAQHSETLISPYFVPGKKGTEFFVARAQDGKQVRILTNSLAANDVAAVHGGYSQYREDLLEGGVKLWELKPLPGSKTKASLFGSSGASLHTKALVVDGERLFVGSYNLDPRSTSLNCEQGVLVTNAMLGAQFQAIFDLQSDGARAWHVTLVGRDLSWTDGTKTYDSEPMATAGQKFQAWLAGVLPVQSQL
jgi:putative cardiolipin synthase